ncbi:amidophosphoribosyltransferase [Ancylomarina euxinus]|uniref:Amidophosphoribosyltransferase n=1 Tax=Ancylomarina euxinus TaxID=2283627 RepID=A0A425Y142_9BACT|nr:amidophosphoribosyltransferase [Ancylomarina euxinus]MCZ4693815.1 amidophosphoribosyltransferase [Ancylomarina euxinus]MUP15106.1 amidophosphoribosyltransferase [Ancylomarina euxinus]RRG21528.1 amidophosphoribosyltransferase [Ancylomarina euxinus]
MSDQLKHECGIALVRLRKPLEYYQEKYGTWQYGIQKLCLLMEKQHNRGQEGAGAASIKIDQKPGTKYINRHRSNGSQPIKDVFDSIYGDLATVRSTNPEKFEDAKWAKENVPFAGEVYLGHLRYGTFGRNSIDFVHPVKRENNWRSRNLVLAGNFNLTNVDELFNLLVSLGQSPSDYTDTVTILEKVGHYLDEENQLKFRQYKNEGHTSQAISPLIEDNLDVQKVLASASRDWDGGYAIAGMFGHGDSFVMRDPWGIRPAYYYQDDEIVVVASERPVIQTALNVRACDIKEIDPGKGVIIRKNGDVSEVPIRVPEKRRSCSFERIYFSRGSDKDIYLERKKLGELLTPAILESIDNDIKNSVFSFIPNTAETAFYGMMEGVRNHLMEDKKRKIHDLNGEWTEEKLQEIISVEPRVEKIAVKDVKLRTFISGDEGRDDLVGHVYDVTYGIVRNGVDNLVIIDDSIVRGTTLKKSILRILDRLHPKKIVVVSSAPQIRYPDCYGIDMTRMGDFCAFNAAIALLKERNMEYIIDEVYQKCKAQENLPKEEVMNYVTEIYKPFTAEEISDKISEQLTPDNMEAEVKIVFQTVENLHSACPENNGDWYFTGDYPTPGGNKVVNTSYINYVEGNTKRAY